MLFDLFEKKSLPNYLIVACTFCWSSHFLCVDLFKLHSEDEMQISPLSSFIYLY